MSILKGNDYCFNCLSKGHLSKHCPSSQRCHKCLMPYHSWLHNESEPISRKSTKEPTPSKTVTSHTSRTINPQQHQVLLMTCQLRITTTHGYDARARALLESASLSSYITERLPQQLRLPRTRRTLQISGIEGIDTHFNSRGVVRFNATNLCEKEKQ